MSIIAKTSIVVRKPVIKIVEKPTPCTYIGSGKVKKVGEILSNLEIKKALVVTDNFLFKSGLVNSMLKSMDEYKIPYVIFDGVLPDPTFAIVSQAQKMSVGCDAVVAIGGGSVIDAAKAVSAAIANNTSAEKLAGLLKVHKRPLPFIAIPTTSGTGSETTVAAVISDSNTHAKKQILDPKIVPMFAILDPELTVGLPQHTTAFTTLDALTHALEAYVSEYADEQTDRMSRAAVHMIFENLPKVRKNPADIDAREALLVASFLAGQAFTRTYVGYVHAFAHTIGGKFGVPHGLANAILLPHIMKYYFPVCHKRFAELAISAGICDSSLPERERAEKFINSLFELNTKCDIPKRFEKFPESEIDDVIKMAFKECHGTYPVPRYFSEEEAKKLMHKVCSK